MIFVVLVVWLLCIGNCEYFDFQLLVILDFGFFIVLGESVSSDIVLGYNGEVELFMSLWQIYEEDLELNIFIDVVVDFDVRYWL